VRGVFGLLDIFRVRGALSGVSGARIVLRPLICPQVSGTRSTNEELRKSDSTDSRRRTATLGLLRIKLVGVDVAAGWAVDMEASSGFDEHLRVFSISAGLPREKISFEFIVSR